MSPLNAHLLGLDEAAEPAAGWFLCKGDDFLSIRQDRRLENELLPSPDSQSLYWVHRRSYVVFRKNSVECRVSAPIVSAISVTIGLACPTGTACWDCQAVLIVRGSIWRALRCRRPDLRVGKQRKKGTRDFAQVPFSKGWVRFGNACYLSRMSAVSNALALTLLSPVVVMTTATR